MGVIAEEIENSYRYILFFTPTNDKDSGGEFYLLVDIIFISYVLVFVVRVTVITH